MISQMYQQLRATAWRNDMTLGTQRPKKHLQLSYTTPGLWIASCHMIGAGPHRQYATDHPVLL